MNPGDVVAARFEILKSAGSGGMGAVYQAHDRSSGRAVALKVLVERDEKLSDRFAQEVELLSALEHPHIVGYVSHGETANGTPFLVMPWLEGEDLQARIERSELSVLETLTLARAVADALAYLHARGLVHRDLKPSNLFLPYGRLEDVQVIDLGIARGTVPLRPMTRSGTLLGTPGFMAPEQARGDYEIAPTADIFSLGCVLFECLTGKRLFAGAHVMAVLAKIIVEEPPRVRELRPDVPDAVDLLVHRMVSKEPERRPRDGAQLREWLDDLRRSPPSSLGPNYAITATEQRVASVLAIVLPRAKDATDAKDAVTKAEADPFRGAATRFGVRLLPLDARTAIALAPIGLVGADQAAALGRFARYVSDTVPGSSVALATGSALAGARLPVGEAIDRAVAIVRAAPPGVGVNVDEVSASLLSSRFDVRRDNERAVLDDERLSLDPTRPLLGQSTACVGRDREFAVLSATYAECASGGPKVALLTAPAGAGKSRVRHEFIRRLGAAQRPPLVLQCSGDPLHMTKPYALLAQAIRQAASIGERDSPESIRETLGCYVGTLIPEEQRTRIVDFLGELLGIPVDDTGHLQLRAARRSAEAMTDQIRLAFEDVTRAWCERQPVVLVLEDLHWGDAPSIRLLDVLLRKLDGSRLFVLALARREVHERFPNLWANRDVMELRLPPIPARACVRLAQSVLGDAVSTENVDGIAKKSEGNGFYLEELIRAAALRNSKRSSGPPTTRGDDLPESVVAVAQARLERLPPEHRRVLRAASVFGESFTVEGISTLVGDPPASLARVIDALVESEIIARREAPGAKGPPVLGFRHVLLRGAVYASLTETDRALAHRLAASWLDKIGEDPELVALHWLEGGERLRAARSFEKAGHARWARAQAESASRCAVRALLTGDAAEEGSDVALGRLALLAEALEAARVIDDQDVIAGIERHIRLEEGRSNTTVPRVVDAAVTKTLDQLRATSDGRVAATASARAACALVALGCIPEASRILADAETLAQDDELTLRTVRYASARVSFLAGDYGATIELLSATLLPSDVRERIGILIMLAIASVGANGNATLNASLELVDRAEELADDPVAVLHCLKARLLCFYFSGAHERAGLAAQSAIDLARKGGLRSEECVHLHNLGEAWLRQGDHDRARAALLSSDEMALEIGYDRVHRHNLLLLAFADGDASRLREVAEGFRRRENAFQELHARYWLGRLLSSAAPSEAVRELQQGLRLAEQLNIRALADDCRSMLLRIRGNS